ncbi:MAG: transcription-repair coupling factor [Firmicutes bacterium]|nr:transcription-repair coupling factor [Bacillota bacterium]
MWCDNLFPLLEKDAGYSQVVEGLRQGLRVQSMHGVGGGVKAFLLAGLYRRLQRFMLVVTPGEESARLLTRGLQMLLGEDEVLLFPGEGFLPFEVVARSPETTAQRLKGITAARSGSPRLMIAPVLALNRRLMPLPEWEKRQLVVKVGQRVSPPELLDNLEAMGFERVDLVEAPGQYAARGGIVDVFPLTESDPLRLEFWDEEVDSIRSFDSVSQRSSQPVPTAVLTPAREVLAGGYDRQLAAERIGQQGALAQDHLQKAGRTAAARRMAMHLETLQEHLLNLAGRDLDHYLAYLYPESVTLLEYLPTGTLVCLDEAAAVQREMERREQEIRHLWEELREEGAALAGQLAGLVTWEALAASLPVHAVLGLSLLPVRGFPLRVQNAVSLNAREAPGFAGQVESLMAEIKRWQKNGFQVVLLVDSEERLAIWKDNLINNGLIPAINPTSPPSGGQVAIYSEGFSQGFELAPARLVVLTESELLGRERRSRKRLKAPPGSSKLSAFNELKAGDYVVHSNHGIGRYKGVERITVAGVQRDYLLVQYAGEDKLYVPTDQVELLHKYIGAEGASPKVNRLGGAEWARVKARVKASVQEVANKLLEIYSERETRPGYRFSPDTVWQKEFEATFPYEETPDQLQAIAEVKRDMESERPMDRLLCGDVGYGKTEVAIRAAFKAVMDGKQVAVLVPTTVLAQQHFQTFRERFANYPVTIESLSRFKSPGEQKQVVARVREGRVDILIGTHRLLSADVSFKDLGLLVVDEEQRFGVMHKERLKELKSTVDVLTLTATPIPRTLHMAIIGVRDMSVIETPPEDRYPVQTYVMEYSPELVREAISRELERGGQVFYVNNRIKELDVVSRRLHRLNPEARQVIAHGQMPEARLERAMLDFIQGERDLLVSTSIIESGLDIPNVNTLVVEDADRLGLSQLYQLRGRVGRSNRIAYAYLTYRRDKVISELAEKRLQTIREFTEFGAGFKIALRDLEIRGAGNLLGAEQHGHMAAVGFDMYCRLLEESVRELKGEPPAVPVALPAVELPVDAYIPDDYVSDPRLKMEIYRRLMLLERPAELEEIREELKDRFGPIPEAMQGLLTISNLRVLARCAEVKTIQQLEGETRIRFSEPRQWSPEGLARLTRRLGKRAAGEVKLHDRGDVSIKTRSLASRQVIEAINAILEEAVLLVPEQQLTV